MADDRREQGKRRPTVIGGVAERRTASGRMRADGPDRRPGRRAPSSREIALEALRRVDEGGYANLVLPELMKGLENPRARFAPIEQRDKAFATELVYGTVRMRRALNWLVQRHLQRDPDEDTERVLHLGAYQLAFLKTPAHAGVSETVACAPPRSQGFVNGVLRSLARDLEAMGDTVSWPDLATELSYPDWIFETLRQELGEVAGVASLRAMNEAATVHTRADGYVQDPASQQVAAGVGAQPGEQILDLCAAPGGKATAMAQAGASVVAVDLHAHRCKLVSDNVRLLGLDDRVEVRRLDATELPEEWNGRFDRVLLDAPCSGLGSLRRRPDARWRIEPSDLDDLVVLQRRLLTAALPTLKPGGVLVYSVCTLTHAETVGIDGWLAAEHPSLQPLPPMSEPGWEPHGRGARLAPGDTDGMCVFRYRVGP